MKNIIFDLSEVIIAGQWGIEKKIAKKLKLDEKTVDDALINDNFYALLRGEITEDEYAKDVIDKECWDISVRYLKEITRKNFHREVEGTKEILTELNEKYSLILLSDNAKEWVEYILKYHEFLKIFDRKYFSHELGCIKKDKEPFNRIVKELKIKAQDTLFIDDNPNNVEIAKSLGMYGIVFYSSEQLRKELTKINVL